MDRVTIWLADENEHYVELMKRYIRTSNFNCRLNISAYTDLECFEHALAHIHSDTVIIASALFMPLCIKFPTSSVILLSEEMNGGTANSHHYVYKYRPLNQLLDQVLNMYYEGKNDMKLGEKGAYNKHRAIAVYAASGGCGVTTMANQLAE